MPQIQRWIGQNPTEMRAMMNYHTLLFYDWHVHICALIQFLGFPNLGKINVTESRWLRYTFGAAVIYVYVLSEAHISVRYFNAGLRCWCVCPWCISMLSYTLWKNVGVPSFEAMGMHFKRHFLSQRVEKWYKMWGCCCMVDWWYGTGQIQSGLT